MSNKSMLIGLVAGVGIAAAGGVAAYQFLGNRSEQGTVAVVEDASPAQAQGSAEVVVARANPAPAPAPRVAQATPAPRPQRRLPPSSDRDHRRPCR